MVNPSAGAITATGIFQAGSSEGEFLGGVMVQARSGTDVIQGTVDVTLQRNFNERVPASVRLLPAIAEAGPGQTVFLTALGMDSTGTLLPSGQPTWEMANVRAGSVTENGRFTAGDAPGSYPDAIRVSLQAGPGGRRITDSLDVLVAKGLAQGAAYSTVVLPQTVILSPGQEFEFDAIVIDLHNGGRLENIPVVWVSSDPFAGSISPDGRFVASLQAGEYPNAVEADFDLTGLPNAPETVPIATSTIVIMEGGLLPSQNVAANQLFLFPQRVIVSPGELASLEVAGLLDESKSMDIEWTLNPEIGDITRSGQVRAGTTPGVYLGAINATVTGEFDGVREARELYSDLVIRGPLATVEIKPPTVTITPGALVQFFAEAKDANGVPLFDTNFQWSMADDAAGNIDQVGSFTATKEFGEYLDAIKVTATQLIK